jgi:hypothetical protein
MFDLESNSPDKRAEFSRRESEADHDQPYRFGHRPRSTHPFPFTTREYARLLIFRSRIRDHRDALDDEAA